ncbi:MAG: PQQ-dependent dehydrogenase, methanol/ethanol family, partial [Candidatus Binatia bacterium]
MDTRRWTDYAAAFLFPLFVAGLLLTPKTGHCTQDLVAMQKDAGQWVSPGKNYSMTRYSELDRITTDNVKNLKVAWTFSTGVLRGHEGAPLVVGDTMYLVTPFPNIVYALDLTKPGSPVKWKYEPK